MHYNQATFVTSAANLAACPPESLAEVAFAGRSNAGKSSAINAITNQTRLARISKTPGRTQLINFFGLAEGRFPAPLAVRTRREEEEERRLFYVALTRAEDDLYLSWPLIRRNLGSEDTFQRVSSFLQEIPPALLEEWQVSGGW